MVIITLSISVAEMFMFLVVCLVIWLNVFVFTNRLMGTIVCKVPVGWQFIVLVFRMASIGCFLSRALWLLSAIVSEIPVGWQMIRFVMVGVKVVAAVRQVVVRLEGPILAMTTP